MDDEVYPRHGVKLTAYEAEVALEKAIEIIVTVGYAENYEKFDDAMDWIKAYFPSRAN